MADGICTDHGIEKSLFVLATSQAERSEKAPTRFYQTKRCRKCPLRQRCVETYPWRPWRFRTQKRAILEA